MKMYRNITAISLSIIIALAGVPAVALADDGQSYNLIAADIESADGINDYSDIDLPDAASDRFIVVPDNPISAPAEIVKVANALDDEDITVDNVENKGDGFFLMETKSEESKTYEDISEIVEDEAPSVKVVPVMTYEPFGSKNIDWMQANVDQNNYIYGGEWSTEETGGYIEPVGMSINKVNELVEKTGNTATVAVIDSGIEWNNGDTKALKGKVLTNLAYVSTHETNVTANMDEEDHGTAVASIITCNAHKTIGGQWFRGATVNTKILPIKANSIYGGFDDIALADAIDYIMKLIDQKKVTNLKAVNMSLGRSLPRGFWQKIYSGYEDRYTESEIAEFEESLEKTNILCAKLKKLHDEYGVAIVCATGNDQHGDDYMTIPSDLDCCVAVAGTDGFNDYYTYSNLNRETDLAAPGNCVVAAMSAYEDGFDEIRQWHEDYRAYGKGDNRVEGTSFAAPMVTSAIVSLMQLNQKLTADQAVQLLKDTASPLDHDPLLCGYGTVGCAGAINVEKAAWKALGRKNYWKGMNDYYNDAKSGLTYGCAVTGTSASNRTVSIRTIFTPMRICKEYAAGSKNIKPEGTIEFPSKVKLGDGNTYKVTEVNMTSQIESNRIDRCTSSSPKYRNVIIPSTVKSLYYTQWANSLGTLTIKSKNLKLLGWGLSDIKNINNVVVDAYSTRASNLKLMEKYKKMFKDYAPTTKVKSFGVSQKAKSLSGAKVTLSKSSLAYTAKPIKPKVTVKLNGKKVSQKNNYTVTYKNNVNAGKATVVIKGTGNYSSKDKFTKTFKITKPNINSKSSPIKVKKISCTRDSYNKLHITSAKFKCGSKTLSFKSKYKGGSTVALVKISSGKRIKAQVKGNYVYVSSDNTKGAIKYKAK